MKLYVYAYNDNQDSVSCKMKVIALKQTATALADGDTIATVYGNGQFELELAPGRYRIEVYKGKLYWPAKEELTVDEEDVVLNVTLKPIIDTRSLGLYSFDAHSHVSRNVRSADGNLEQASTIMKGEDFNIFFAGSPYDLETHLQDRDGHIPADQVPYREKYASIIAEAGNDHFILDIGNEIVKCRYGHMFLLNYDQRPPYSKHYDRAWDPWLFTKIGDEPKYDILYPYEALQQERGANSVAVAAHSTSWWYQGEEFISNIAATLGFEILAGSIDAMVIMGYDSDHVHYQNLWYEVLNNGYYMPGVAETDHTFDSNQSKHLAFKTYTYLEAFNLDALCTSIKAGRNIVSTGPIVLLDVNGHLPGAVLNYEADEAFIVQVEAYRCYEAPLRKMELILGGKVWKEYDIVQDVFDQKERLTVREDSYLVAKCYDAAGNVAITNPVYIRNAPFRNRAFTSALTVQVTKGGNPAEGQYWIGASLLKTSFSGVIHCSLSVDAELSIEVGGTVQQVKLFELDELQAIFRKLYFGYFNKHRRYAAGEVPVEYFELSRIRELLTRVDLHIRF
ncbi:hypothetical protein FHS18_005237 [Paenibacillus phyllosphaerae]|uniref:Carboxypeptidase regulatory-like domain-containing protein n=1 Tax=Paenibacillus phyllosphaerae TaxID=274593 RepID=A0A7W5B2A3_9BACL|nr:CehA/McbA family metallohydrolase [Paenibacillus phyllosphaerae]MBB3113134.1 hypothetical protein [Paenibacillus phyllosphaerae]